MISQGTISVLFGVHALPHSLLVAKAWKMRYGRWPKPWELGCILLHDIGHIGKNYLDDHKLKEEHWRLGAEIAGVLFGWKGFLLCAGHCRYSGYKESRMYMADKIAWSLSPIPLLMWCAIVEPKIRGGAPILEHVLWFKQWTKENVERDAPLETHEAYLEVSRRSR